MSNNQVLGLVGVFLALVVIVGIFTLTMQGLGGGASANNGRFVTEATWNPDGARGTGYVVCDTKTGNLLYYVVAGTAVGVTVVPGGCNVH